MCATAIKGRNGFARDAAKGTHHPEAVRWWYVAEEEDGAVFARGGRVTTTQEARQAVYEAELEYKRDLALRDALRGVGLVARYD